ncbi:unnamed protein product [Clavelina lepadiformis]|uniref:Uncharacterized protein n=1 Tax=Clavelina lepadiformis TaxID=159417 RepID=A0ABP0G535_CLALP
MMVWEILIRIKKIIRQFVYLLTLNFQHSSRNYFIYLLQILQIAFTYFQNKRLEPVIGLKRHHQRYSSLQFQTKRVYLSASIGQHWHLFPYITVDVPEKLPSCNEQYCHLIFQRLIIIVVDSFYTNSG